MIGYDPKSTYLENLRQKSHHRYMLCYAEACNEFAGLFSLRPGNIYPFEEMSARCWQDCVRFRVVSRARLFGSGSGPTRAKFES